MRVYVGPYLAWKHWRDYQGNTSPRGCVRKNCSFHNPTSPVSPDWLYCPICAATIEQRHIFRDYPNDIFASPYKHVYIPDQDYSEGRDPFFFSESKFNERVQSIDGEKIEGEKEFFLERFEEVIEDMRKFYGGEDQLRVEWGVVCYV